MAKLLFDRCQESDILLDGEAADEAENEVVVGGIPIAMGRREGFGVDAACHQVARPAGGAFEQGAEFRVGCEEDTRLLVVEGGGPQRGRFDLTANARTAGAEETCEPSGAGGCVFMHIGVPGGDQRHTKAVGDPSPMKPSSEGPVMWMMSGWKRRCPRGCAADAANTRGRNAGPSLRGMRRRCGGLEGADGAIFACTIGRSCTFAEEGQIATASEGLKVAAGVGNAIDLVEGVGEVGNSGRSRECGTVRGRGHDGSVCGAPAKRKAGY